jgi:lipid-binding SYLF domain-containing protein
MMTKKYKARAIVTACSLALASFTGLALAQTTMPQSSADKAKSPMTNNQNAGAQSARSDMKDASQQLKQAAKVVKQMERDAKMKDVLQQAQGIFIVPDYKRAVSAGAGSADGVMVVKENGDWSNPVFYQIGADKEEQPGVTADAIVMILNNDKAVDRFMQDNSWRLDDKSGLTVANWSEKAVSATPKNDVIVWADKKDALGDKPFNVSDIKYDDRATAAFYGKQVAQQDVFGDGVKAPPQVAELKQALPGASGSASGASAGGAAAGSPSSSADKSPSGSAGGSPSAGSTEKPGGGKTEKPGSSSGSTTNK